jgi:hypothetical protein
VSAMARAVRRKNHCALQGSVPRFRRGVIYVLYVGLTMPAIERRENASSLPTLPGAARTSLVCASGRRSCCRVSFRQASLRSSSWNRVSHSSRSAFSGSTHDVGIPNSLDTPMAPDYPWSVPNQGGAVAVISQITPTAASVGAAVLKRSTFLDSDSDSAPAYYPS